MKLITLSHNCVTKISEEDYELVNKHNWFAYRISGKSHTGKVYLYGYKAGFKKQVDGKRKNTWLHNFIMKPEPGFVVDHIDGDTLNNTRENLRVVSVKDNNKNRGKRSNGLTSKYLGVSKDGNRFKVSIGVNGKTKHVGSFILEIDAALAYNVAATKYFGEFARLNII